MSAGSIPYQLRPNKAVDRLLFFELCNRLARYLSIESEYQYIGFGGPQMEDFRILHERFQRLPMLSIESLAAVIPRQRFNCPHTMVSIASVPQTSDEFLTDWEPTQAVILWFDYASKSERNDQIAEFQTILAKAQPRSILRITMNADPPGGENKKPEDVFKAFKSQFSQLMPYGATSKDMTAGKFPAVLLKMLEMAAAQVLQPAGDFTFKPLLITDYRDSTRMITLAGIKASSSEVQQIVTQCLLEDWPYLAKDWQAVQRINMPELTIKERIFINQLLPNAIGNASDIQAKLGFQLDEDANLSLEKIKNYTEFYRHFPQFGRVAI